MCVVVLRSVGDGCEQVRGDGLNSLTKGVQCGAGLDI